MLVRSIGVLLTAGVIFAAGSYSTRAQSTDPNFPTAITSNEINGVIKARDIGDPRMTQYYYAFDGSQGDIFINVTTKNLSADIDVYLAEGLKPLTKMVIYPDGGVNETGRLIYLRKPERMILRIEGRTPSDESATFRIKFGGSFVAKAASSLDSDTKQRETGTTTGGIKVNSVGTILESPPPEPVAKTPDAKPKLEPSEPKAPEGKPVYTAEKTKPEVVITSTIDESKAATTTVPPKTNNKPASPPANRVKPPPATTAKKPDPMENFRLVVELKDGGVIEHPMTDVLRFTVERGQLLVTTKDGAIKRYSMLDVAQITVK